MVLEGATLSEPESDLDPNQPSVAVQEAAFELDQVKIEVSPRLIVEGFAFKLTVGPETTKVSLVTVTTV